MAVTYTLDHAGSLVVKVKAVGPHGAYCNEHPIPVNVEVWLGSPPPPPRRLASPHRLGRGRLVSLQVHFYEDDVRVPVLYLCDGHSDQKKKGLREGCRGYRLCIEARPIPLRSRALPPVFRACARTGAVSLQRPVPPGSAGYVLRVYEPSSQMPDAAFSARA